MTLRELAAKNCQPCKNTSPMSQEEATGLVKGLRGWALDRNSIEKEFRFESYMAGLDFAYSIGELAEEQDHHPDMMVKWQRVKLVFSTHAIKGLSLNDFVMAAKSQLEYERLSSKD